MKKLQDPVLIYNLFPRLVGAMNNWGEHFQRAAGLGFNWVYLNPLAYPGFSGSLYSIKDYYQINPLFLDGYRSEEDQVRGMISNAHSNGLKVMFDLVINHTAFDSVLVEQHRDWYLQGPRGGIKHPQVWAGNKLVATWGDLAEIDNENSSDRQGLWDYWKDLIDYYLDFGVDGFRCDAAYQVPVDLWEYLIPAARSKNSEVLFVAETLGCRIDKVIALATAGFDFTFNSSKWWDFKDKWCLDQYRENAVVAPSISFAESHDTPRLAKELENNEAAIKMRYLFSVVYSSGVMMPVGFEFGFKKRMNVVRTTPDKWESINIDLQNFIRKSNRLKKDYQVFREDNELEVIDVGNRAIFAFLKKSLSGEEKALIILNRSLNNHRHFKLDLTEVFQTSLDKIKDISVEYNLDIIPELLDYDLRPAQVMIFYTNSC